MDTEINTDTTTANPLAEQLVHAINSATNALTDEAHDHANHHALNPLEPFIRNETRELLEHPLYTSLNSLEDVRTFMSAHVFAVWDFMSLLKSLQNRITCVQIPWVPQSDHASVRFINEIVLAEESDEISPGVFLNHYELYLRAMEEVGADTSEIRNFVQRIANGERYTSAIDSLFIAPETKEFVHTSLEMARAPVHVAAASFFYGREDIIPQMFQRLLDKIETQNNGRFDGLRLYLSRHIEIDQGTHGPLAQKLVANLCKDDETKWNEVIQAARRSIRARTRLWDGIIKKLN